MARIIVERGKLGKKYTELKNFDGRKQGSMGAAWIAFYNTKLKAGEQKRLRIKGGRILKHLSCYWT